jgi:hypothetical protein
MAMDTTNSLSAAAKAVGSAAFRVDRRRLIHSLEQPPFNAPVTRDQTGILLVARHQTPCPLLVGSANYEDGLPVGAVARSYDLSTRTVIDTLPAMDSSCGPLALADYDNDGDLDSSSAAGSSRALSRTRLLAPVPQREWPVAA